MGRPATGNEPRRRWLAVGLLGVLVVALGVAAVRFWTGRHSTPAPRLAGLQPEGPAQRTWLLVGTGPQAGWLTLLGADDAGERAFVLDLPPSSLAVVSGYGSLRLSQALAVGGEPLVASAVSGLLGIALDHTLQLSDQALQGLFDGAGGLTVDPGPPPRPSHLDGRALIAYIAGSGPTGGPPDELARGGRRNRVWASLLARYRIQDGGAALGQLVAGHASAAAGAPTGAEGFFTSLVAPGEGGTSFAELPVTPAGVRAGGPAYRPDAAAVQAVVQQHLAGSRLTGARLFGRRLEILNGTGAPAALRRAALLLVPHGFPIVRQADASRSDYAMTQIVVYSGSEAARRAADDIRSTLGAGKIVVSGNMPGAVDVTVILGRDFEIGGT